MKKVIYLIYLLLFALLQYACSKNFLEIKQNQNLRIPKEVKDFQAILDVIQTMNANSCHELGIIGADEYFIESTIWETLTVPHQKNGYIWADEVYEGKTLNEWDRSFNRILMANMAAEVEKIKPNVNEIKDWENVLGSALFFRGINYYQLVQTFCLPYDAPTADKILGMPLRMEPDITVKSKRSSLEESYQQILSDLHRAYDLLPEIPLIKYRPSKPAVAAYLAKTYLLMGNYEKSLEYANDCLGMRNELVDFNTIDLTLRYIMPRDYEVNQEILFMSNISNLAIFNSSRFNVDTVLYASYQDNDLRKYGYFHEQNGRKLFKGSHTGVAAFFTGIATDEVYLIQAECYARLGMVKEGNSSLNILRRHRYSKEGYVDLNITNERTLLQEVLEERRKELYVRGTRWEDIRRLNLETSNPITIKRLINNKEFLLLPNSPRFAWLIPIEEIDLSGIEQNER